MQISENKLMNKWRKKTDELSLMYRKVIQIP